MEDKRLNEWEEVEKKIEVSRIKRFGWSKMLGESLTARIHRLRNKGHNSDETYSILIRNPNIQKYIRDNPLEAEKLLENLKISVCARNAESRTVTKIGEEDGKNI